MSAALEVPAASRSRRPGLVFCRAYLIDDFRANLEPFGKDYEFHFLTDGRAAGATSTTTRFYPHHAAGDRCAALSNAEVDDIVRRCRLLRNLDRHRAERLLHAMALTVEAEFARVEPAVVVCHMVDEYVTHLVATFARKSGVKFVGYCFSYFPDLIQVTQFENGRPFDVREPADDEVERIYAKLTAPRFRQNYAQKPRGSLARHLYAIGRYQAKRAYFWAKGHAERDPLNVHYMITPYIAEFRRMSDFPKPDAFDGAWRDKVAAARADGRKVLYLPLGYFPESTIDYWTPNTAIIDYERTSIEMLRALATRYTVLVKEHPHMIGARPGHFYDELRKIANVVAVEPLEFASEVMDQSDAIVLGGGSGGVEATLRGMPVFSYAESCYWFSPSRAVHLDLDAIASWPQVIADGIERHRPLTQEERRGFLRACLRSTMRRRPGGRIWPLCDVGDFDELLRRAVGTKLESGSDLKLGQRDRVGKR